MVEDAGKENYSSDESRWVMQFYGKITAEKGNTVPIPLQELLNIIEKMERMRLSWKAADDRAAYFEEQYTKTSSELESVSTQLRRCNAELKDARAQIRAQIAELNAQRADAEEMSQRLKLVSEYLKSDLERLPVEKSKQLAFLRNPELIRTNSKRVIRERYMEEGDTEETDMDYDVTGDTLDTLDEVDEENERRARNRSVGLRGPRSISAHAHPASSVKRSRSRPFDAVPINENEETRDSPLPPKRSRETTEEITTTTTVTIDPNRRKPSQARVTIRRSMNRSMSANDLLDKEKVTPCAPRTPFVPRTTSTLELVEVDSEHINEEVDAACENKPDDRTPMRTPGGGSWTHGKPIESRPHHFQPLSTYFKITSCDVCHGGINFAAKPAYKCTDCLQLAHVSCSTRLPLPCVPRSFVFPRTPNKRGVQVYQLQEFCPSKPPMIAYPIIHCIVDLESRGLSREGLYRVPGRKDHVQSVLNELRTSRGIPKLKIQETEVVADVVKAFLRDLRDPLIPKSSREEFVRAAQTENILALNVAVCDLPQPNRDTLSYLMLHLQKIEALKELNKMSFENIARCMAVAIMGQPQKERDIQIASESAREKERSVLQMLKMSSEYWRQFLEPEDIRPEPSGVGRTPASPSTPHQPSCVDRSMLGPVTVSPAAPNLLRPIPRRPQKFFDSPL
ncbi:hypothetical protein RB195_001618 [Necator americanus]|uniref:RhoGAP domain protein n=1 Tax=Necator americanus TaxID=51031 RepID=A0ABR1DFE2_NECAM